MSEYSRAYTTISRVTVPRRPSESQLHIKCPVRLPVYCIKCNWNASQPVLIYTLLFIPLTQLINLNSSTPLETSTMALITPPDRIALSLALCILLSTYTTYLCGTPPNPTPYNSTSPDSMKAAVTPRALFIRRSINVSLGIYHAFLCLTYPSPPLLSCPHPSQLASHLFTWTPYSSTCITTILLGCYIRLSAFSTLGSNFTFRLTAPKKLVTSGLYNYVQHPSYTGKILIIVGNWALIQNTHGPIGCWLPMWIVEARWFWRLSSCLIVLGVSRITWKRVNEEEMMLKSTFGKEWEDWHMRTKRFVPGLF